MTDRFERAEELLTMIEKRTNDGPLDRIDVCVYALMDIAESLHTLLDDDEEEDE